MTLEDRLKMKGQSVAFSNKQVDGLLAGTLMVLVAVKADLLENEPGAQPAMDAIEKVIEFLPEDMTAVKEVDRARAAGTR